MAIWTWPSGIFGEVVDQALEGAAGIPAEGRRDACGQDLRLGEQVGCAPGAGGVREQVELRQ